MNFIANLLITISNNTIPLAYLILVLGIFVSLIQGLGKIKKLKNELILKEITPKVEEIKAKYTNENEQLDNLSKLYKEHHFSAITPVIINILGVVLYMALLFTVFYGKNFVVVNCLKPITFFGIENIFIKTTLIVFPIIIILLKIIALYIFIPKELVDKKSIAITVISYAISIAVFSNILAPTYSIFLLGTVLGEFLINLYYNKQRRNLFYKYPPVQENKEPIIENTENNEDVKKPNTFNGIDLNQKKSFKELVKDVEKALNDEMNGKK